MALVVLLRGVNVGGHRTFRPAALASQLGHLDAVNIGAAGTFVIRRPTPKKDVCAEFARRLPFETEIVICRGQDVVALMSNETLAPRSAGPGIVSFVSVLSRRPRLAPELPVTLPARGQWMLRVVAREGPFLVGQYRREMRTIGYLSTLDRVFGVPVTTRNWNTMSAIAKVLGAGPA